MTKWYSPLFKTLGAGNARIYVELGNDDSG